MEKTAGVGTNVNARLAVKNPYNWCRCRRLIVDHCYNSSEREPGFLCDRSTVDTHRACSLGLAFPSPPAACPTLAGIPLQRSLWSFPFFSLSRPGKKKKNSPLSLPPFLPLSTLQTTPFESPWWELDPGARPPARVSCPPHVQSAESVLTTSTRIHGRCA